MRHVDLRPQRLRNQPVARQRNAVDPRRIALHRLFPRGEIDRAGNGVSITNCANVTSGALGQRRGRVERVRPVARQPEDERAEHVHAVLLERAQPLDQRRRRRVEVLVDVLQAFGRDRLDADQRALDARRRIASRNSGSSAASIVICVKKIMSSRQLRQLLHQLEPLGAQRLQFGEPRRCPSRRSAMREVGRASPDRSCRRPAR